MNPHAAVFETTRRFAPLAFLALVSSVLTAGCHGPANFLVELGEARQTAADLRVQFNREADASNRAVMADTDESSVAFAHEAEVTTQSLENDRAALASVLGHLNYATETVLFALATEQRRFH